MVSARVSQVIRRDYNAIDLASYSRKRPHLRMFSLRTKRTYHELITNEHFAPFQRNTDMGVQRVDSCSPRVQQPTTSPICQLGTGAHDALIQSYGVRTSRMNPEAEPWILF
jgi:hypothetical protein